MRILLINNYDSYADLLAYTLGCVSGTSPTVIYNDAQSAETILAGGYERIVLSPGPGHPARPQDFGVCAEVIARTQVPTLGVCLGHQGIAMVAGAKLKLAPEVKHGKRSRIQHTGHVLFAGLPSPFWAMRYHSWVVDPAQLPQDVEVLAHAEDDGSIMALGLRSRPVVGVQFHPESVGTPWGRRILHNFLCQTADTRHARGVSRAPHVNQAPRKSGASRARRMPSGTGVASPKPRRLYVAELPWRDAEQVFDRLYASREHAFWLDSAASSRAQRWSFMGAARRVLEIPARTSQPPWEALRRQLGPPPEGSQDLPCPFAGGLVGYLGYELQRHGHDATPTQHGAFGQVPDAHMQHCHRFLAFDHLTRRIWAVTANHAAEAAHSWLHGMRALWHKPWPAWQPMHTTGSCQPGDMWPQGVHASMDRAAYRRRIAWAQERIRQGDIYEVCLSNRFHATGSIDPWHLYRILRHTHPAPYAAFIKGPTSSVLSASPERFLTLDTQGSITTEPIKGTRAHIGTPGAIAFQRRQLRHSPKDQAELLMVVDLLRNDIARIAKPGSLQVPELFALTQHPTVIQMSARITALLQAGHDAVDLLRACFPGGSITGAPKRRAMDIIAQLEGQPRGVYTGAIGYLSTSGTMDLNVAIRTMQHDARGVRFGAGGAITADSDPHGECDEVESKAFGLARALVLARDGRCGGMRLDGAQLCAPCSHRQPA